MAKWLDKKMITQELIQEDIRKLNNIFPFQNAKLFNHVDNLAIYEADTKTTHIPYTSVKELKRQKYTFFSIDSYEKSNHVRLTKLHK